MSNNEQINIVANTNTKYLVCILSSSDLKLLKLSLETVEKQINYDDYHIYVVINTLNDNYYNEVIDNIKIMEGSKLKKIIKTQSNGKPGKGHNSLLNIFYESKQYDNLIILDGDDFFYPESILRINIIKEKTNFDVLTLSGSTMLKKNYGTTKININGSNSSMTNFIQKGTNYIFQQSRINKIGDIYNKILATPFRLISINRKIIETYGKLYYEQMSLYDDFLYYIICYFNIGKTNINIQHVSDRYIYIYNKINENSVSKTTNDLSNDDKLKKKIFSDFKIKPETFDATKFDIIPHYLDNFNVNFNVNLFYKELVNKLENKINEPQKNFIFIDFDTWTFNNINGPLGGTESAILYLSLELSKLNNNVCVMTNNDSTQVINENLTYHTLKTFTLNNFIELMSKYEENYMIIQCSKYNDFFRTLKQHFQNKLKIINWIQHDINIRAIKNTGLTEFNGFDGYLFVSNWQKYRFIQKFNFDHKICHVLQNGYSSLINYVMPPLTKTKTIMFCSSPYRGLYLAYDMFKIIKTHIPDIKFKIFSCYGRDLKINKTSYDKITNMSQLNNCNNHNDLFQELISDQNVELYGSVPQAVLFEHYKECMLLFYPNVYPETCCTTLLEAMMHKCNIITSNIGALAETSSGYATLYDPVIDVYNDDFGVEELITKPIRISDVNQKYANNFIAKTISTINNYFSQENQEFLEKQHAYARDKSWYCKADELVSLMTEIKISKYD
jgi:glycosyltransferase involved in cell wall biosynthesis